MERVNRNGFLVGRIDKLFEQELNDVFNVDPGIIGKDGLIHGKDIFWIIVSYCYKMAQFALSCFFIQNGGGDLPLCWLL